MIKTAKTFKNFIELSKGTHPIEEVFQRLTEIYDAKSRHNVAEDGLRKPKHFDPIDDETWD